MAQVVTDPDVLKQFAAAPDMDMAPKPQAAAGQAGAVVTDPDILKQFNSAPEYNPSPVGPQPAPAPPSPPPPRPTANDNIISATLDKANPEEQAKAKAIGSQLNVPTGIVLRNMPGYNKAAERQNAIAEVSSNPMLRDWVAEHPDNAKIAMDDFAALKRALVATADFGTTAYMTLSQFSGDKVVRAGVDAAAKAGAIGWADTKVDADLAKLDKLGESYGLWDLKDNKQGGLGYLNRGVVMFLPAMLALGIKSTKAGFYGAFEGWGGAMQNLTEQLGLQGELTGVLSGEFMHPGGFSGLHVPHPTAIEPGFEHLSPAKMRVQQLIEPFRKADEVKKGDAPIETQATGAKFPNTAAAEPYVPPFNRSIEVYLENGEEPPTGHDYLTDQLHIQQTIKDADSFQKAYDVVKEAKLKKRSPEDLTDLLDKQLDGQSVYIPAETVQKLYEGVEPHPKDERLGWADNAQQKVATAQALGTDMEVPLSQFLAHADDSLVGAIKDQIRFREKGPSVEEAKVLQDKEPETYPVHTQAPRDAVGDLYDSNPELFPMKRKVIDSGRTGRPTKTEPIKPGATEKITEEISKKITPPALPDVDPGELHAAGLDLEANKYVTGEEGPGHAPGPIEVPEEVGVPEEAPTDISAAARIPHPEIRPEVPKPPEGPPPLPKGVEAPKPAEAPKPPPVPKTFDNLGTVATQGLVDDAVESVKGVQNPRIDLTVDPLTRTVTVHDNGAGYSPEELTNHLETSDLNKVLYLHHNTGIVIYTLHDGEFSTIKSDGRGIRGAYKAGERFEPDTRPEQPDDAKMFPDGHGTRIELDVPSEYLHPKDGQLKPIDLPEQPRVEIPPHIEATVNGAKLEEAPTASQVVPPPIPEETPLTRAIKRERKALYLDPLFNAKSVGMDQNWFAAYSRKIAVQARDIYQKALEAARKQVAKRLTPEWKADRARTRTETERDMFSHPTIAAERFIRLGELPTGEHVPKPLLDEKAVADLGGKNLDRYTIKKRGQHPDDIAPRVGFKTGKEMIDALNNFEKQRAGYDKSPREFIDHLIDRETDFRMEEQFGDLKEKILDEAREIVTTNTHIEIMADELKKIAELGKIPFDKDTLPTEVHKQFQGHSARTVSYEKFRRAAEKHAKEAEKALLKGDYIGAFQAKQKQYMDVLHAKEARVFEKKRATAEKQWRRITSQDKAPNTNTQEYWDNARKILNDISFRKIDNLQEPAIDLNTLINNSSGQAAVAPWLVNITPGVEYKNLPVVAFDALHDSIRSIIHAGAEARKLDSLHGKATLDNFIFDVGQLFSRFPTVVSDRSGTIRQQIAWRVRWGLASHTLVERMLDYSDKFDPDGVLTRFLDRPMRDSWNKEVELKEMVMTMARDLEQHTDKSVNDLIDNKAIRDPNHGGYVPMTRQNLRHIILWSGSEEGLAKLTKGYNISHDQLFDLIQKNARPEDFAWANQYFKIFEKLYEEAAPMVRRYTGVEMDKRVARPWGMKLKDGTIVNNDGGYAPLYYDHTKPGGIRNPGLKGDLFDENYFPVTTPHSYTQDVTKAAGWLDMNGTLLTNKIQQMIHDIAFRESVRNAQKIITDSRFRQLVNRHWGTEYTAQLDSWLKTIANVHAQDDDYAQGAANVMAHLRVGTVNTLINMSRSVAMKHGVSALAMSIAQRGYASMSAEFARLGGPAMYAALKQLWQKPTKFLSPDERETARQFLKDPSSMDFVMNSSPFMRERLRPYADSLRGALQRGSEAGIMQGARQAVAFSDQVGRTMVAMSDAGSAFTTWTGAYKDALMKHGDHADAVFEADRAVGRAHGSSFPGDKPKILQIPNTASGQFWKTVTSLYSYWSHAMNNMMQLGWDIKARTMRGAGSEPGANIASIAHRVFLLAIVPMIMEEAAAPAMSGDEHGGWLRKGTFAALRFMGGLSPYTRDVASMIFEGYEPTVGMIGQALKEGYQMRQDAASWINNDKEGKNWIKHFGTALGTLRVPFASQAAGALVQGVSKQMRGQATPKWENDDWTAEQYRALYGTGNIPKKVWRKR